MHDTMLFKVPIHICTTWTPSLNVQNDEMLLNELTFDIKNGRDGILPAAISVKIGQMNPVIEYLVRTESRIPIFIEISNFDYASVNKIPEKYRG